VSVRVNTQLTQRDAKVAESKADCNELPYNQNLASRTEGRVLWRLSRKKDHERQDHSLRKTHLHNLSRSEEGIG
jgi:hypothetical protein